MSSKKADHIKEFLKKESEKQNNVIAYQFPRYNQSQDLIFLLNTLIAQQSILESKLQIDQGNMIDLRSVSWITPISILPLAATLYNYKERGFSIGYYSPDKDKCSSYLDTIRFFEGAPPSQGVEYRVLETYLPIVKFSVNDKSRNELIYAFADMLCKLVKCGSGLANALSYLVGELIINIVEHSNSNYCWAMAQYYDSTKILEICILDTGIGMKECYYQAGKSMKDDLSSIEAALNGISTKNDEERGFGFRTTFNLVTESELKGAFFVLTGAGALYKNAKSEPSSYIINKWGWQGTLIGMRIKKVNNIDYLKYVE